MSSSVRSPGPPQDRPGAAKPRRIDAHQHLWHFDAEQYPWLNNSLRELRRDFTPHCLRQALASAGIDASVAVQARQTLTETSWLLECAETNPFICAVVGWAPLLDPGLSTILDQFSTSSRFVGLREILQTQALAYFDHPALDQGIAELTRRGLTFDLLITADQLPQAARLVDRHPHQRFILDHAGKPHIAAAELEPWATHLRELARRHNVLCKLSGLVTEASWTQWTQQTLTPYLDTCVDVFGPGRLIAGSDWPVCLVATGYDRWFATLSAYFALFSQAEKDGIFGGNAITFYQLESLNRSVEPA